MNSPEHVCMWPAAGDDDDDDETHLSNQSYIPEPPPPSDYTSYLNKRCQKKPSNCRETKDTWDKFFKQGYGADVYITTDSNTTIPAHSSFLRAVSSVLEGVLQQSKPKNGKINLKLPGMPLDAVYMFIRFLYSSRYEEDDMKNYVLHLLVLSHAFSVPQLKRVCEQFIEHKWLTTENVVDVLQLARNCDDPRLSLKCIRMIVREFKSVSLTDGWKVMRIVNPSLEQELLESAVESDSRKQERLVKEEKRVYVELHEAMEALVHICKDGCRSIGPRHKTLKQGQIRCNRSACKCIEMLVRHFSGCKRRVRGGCVHCNRFWQLLELHSRMCNHPEPCTVPLCWQFKKKLKHSSKKDEAKWRLLVTKVMEAKSVENPFLSKRLSLC